MCDCCENSKSGCNACGNSLEEELEFLYCSLCHKRVALVAEAEENKIIKCCGTEMINLSSIPSDIGNVFECKKCKAKIIVEDDCNCFLDKKEHAFVCCGEKMALVGTEKIGCGCSDEDDCNCDEDTQFLTCTKCKSLVSVAAPCTCENCDITCCGKPIVDPQNLKAHAGELFVCSKCGAKMVVEEESFVENESQYEPVSCCEEKMVCKGESAESEVELDSETNTALFCNICERIIITEENNAGKMICCGKPMIDINSVEDFSGEMFECKKCKIKVIIEEDSMTGVKAAAFECCGQEMIRVTED